MNVQNTPPDLILAGWRGCHCPCPPRTMVTSGTILYSVSARSHKSKAAQPHSLHPGGCTYAMRCAATPPACTNTTIRHRGWRPGPERVTDPRSVRRSEVPRPVCRTSAVGSHTTTMAAKSGENNADGVHTSTVQPSTHCIVQTSRQSCHSFWLVRSNHARYPVPALCMQGLHND